MSQSPRLSIIIVNLNGVRFLRQCLNSIFSQGFTDFEVILVDNHSTDDSLKMIHENFPTVQLIELEKNFGFAEGNNIGYKKCRGNYILFLNNDAILGQNTLAIMINEFEKIENAGIIQPKIILTGNRGLDECGSFLTRTGFVIYNGLFENPDNPLFNKLLQVFSIKGACMLTKKEIIDKVGLFDSDFFLFFEEKDLCHRIWIGGYKVCYVPSAEVYHFWGATTNPQNKVVPDEYQFHSYKNRICSYLKNFETIELIKIMPIHLSLLLSISLYYAISGNVKMSRIVIKSISWNIINIKNTLKKRRYIQKNIRKVKDRVLMPIILKKKSTLLVLKFNFLTLKNERKMAQ